MFVCDDYMEGMGGGGMRGGGGGPLDGRSVVFAVV